LLLVREVYYFYKEIATFKSMKIKTILFIFFIGALNITYCQQKENIYFDSIYNCNNVDYSCALSVCENSMGYIAVGTSYNSLYHRIICVLKTDKQGKQTEIKNFEKANCHLWPGGSGSFIKTMDGGYALGGGVTSSLNDKALLVKFDANGDTLWTKEYGDNISESYYTARQCKQTWDKGFVLVGEKSLGNHNSDFLLIKTDSAGNLKWQKTLGGPDIEMGWSIVVTPDGGFFIGGYKWLWNTAYSYNALVYKTDSLGNIQWQKEFGGAFDDGAAMVNIAKDGNYFVMLDYAFSQPASTEPSYSKLNIIKLDNSGNVIWDKKVGPLRWAYNVNGFYELPNDNIFGAGFYIPSTGVGLATIFMLNSVGDSIWMRDYKRVLNNGTNSIYNIQQTSDYGFITCGQVFGAGEPPNGNNMWLLKLDSAGCLEPNCDGVNIVEPLVKDNGELKIYPNPAQDKININLAGLHMFIYNIEGQLLLQQDLKQNNTEIDISQLESGVYIAKIMMGNGDFLLERFVVIK
jgi:hypothetical protein